MLRRWLTSMLWCAGLLMGGGAYAQDVMYHVGATQRVVHPARERNWRGATRHAIVSMIWYPVDANVSESAYEIGAPGDPIFKGHLHAVDAPFSTARSRYPLLMLSHGTGGTAADLDWLGAALAAHGYVVVGVNHPGNTALGPLTPDGFTLWWERAADVSDVLDAVLADPRLGEHIDAAHIGAVGFSLGGYTVLLLAGARTQLAQFEAFCASPQADAICHPPEIGRMQSGPANASDAAADAARAASREHSGDDYRDRRILAVLAIAPALGEAFDSSSFADVSVPVALLAGEADTTAPVDTNIRRIASFLPNASVTLLPGASHYTFLDACLPAVTAKLARICEDNPGVDREAVHAQTIDFALRFFRTRTPVGG